MPNINTEYDIGKAFEVIENELIASMIRNMRRHKLEEVKEKKQWAMWQAEQLKNLEKYKAVNQKKYGKQFRNINRKIDALIQAARNEGEMSQEEAILKAIKAGFPAKRISKGAEAEFFKINDRKLDALIQATTKDMQTAETAVLRMANDQYRKVIYNAQVYANTGAGTYEQSVDMATKDFLSAGLNCVEYADGARHTLADYADMAIRTAVKRAYLQGEGQKRQEWGIHTVIVNKRGNPCPKCLPFVGKVLIDDVWSGGSRKDGAYPLMSAAVAAGLYHPRCRDSHTTYFPGISTADDTWTKAELEAIGQNVKEEARQQYAERQEKRFGRMAEYSLEAENQKKYAARREEWKRRQAELTNVEDVKRHGGGPEQAETIALRLDSDYQQRIKARRAAYQNRQRNANDVEPVDFSKMDRNALIQWQKANLKTVFDDLKGVNVDYLRDTVKVLSDFERKMGGKTISGLRVKFGGISKNVYAKYDDKEKTLYLKKSGSKEAFEKSQKEENIRFRYKWKRDKDYYATETYTGTIWHELGHAVDIDTNQYLSRKLSATPELEELSVKVSGYAGTTGGVRVSKRSEAWAENFSAYMDGGKNKAKVPKEIADMIEGYFKESIAKRHGSDIIRKNTGIQFYLRIPDEKFTKYALDFTKDPNKARAFKEALGYTKDNYRDLIDNISNSFDENRLIEKSDNGFGMRYSQVMNLTGANGKTAKVMTAWIYDEDIRDYRLTSAYIDKR